MDKSIEQVGESVVASTTSKIRDFVNDSVIKKTSIFAKKNDGDWTQFFAALDTIEDTSLAIKGFQIDSDKLFTEHPYIATYGILQALYIQQDAVNYLKAALFGVGKKIDFKNDRYIELMKIRNLRNETIGHPIKASKKGKGSKYENDEITSCTIDRSSINNEGFKYMLWMHSGTQTKHVKFKDVVSLQDSVLGMELNLILKELQKEEKAHKSKFKNEKLANFLKTKSLYEVKLIYGVRWDDHLAWPSFEYFYNHYKKARAGLESRYGKFGSITRIQGTELVIKKLDYVFSKLDGFRLSGRFEEYEFEVYVDALDTGLKELQIHLEQIDNEFLL